MSGKLLIARIEKAFAEVRREDGITLAESRVIDRCGSEAERAKAHAQASDKLWQDVPDTELEKHANALWLLDPKGFCYYLPAYMRWCIRHLKTSKSETINSAIYALSPSARKGVSQRNLECWPRFSREQNHVIFKFLRLMVGQYDGPVDTFMAQLALDAHWKQYNQKPAKPPPGIKPTSATTR